MSSNISIAAFERWTISVANIIDGIDSDDLSPLFLDAISSFVQFEFATAYVYTGQCKPFYVCDTFRNPKAKRGIANYLDNTYILNPVYIAYLNGISEGIYRIGDLAPDEYFESGHYRSLKVSIAEEEEIGYLTKDWPRGMEEVVMMIQLPDKCMGEISFLQSVDGGGFSESDLEAMALISPVISAVFRRYWQRVVADNELIDSADSFLDDALSQFGSSILTPRECEITRYILRGHSSISVSMHLNISMTTVKTHRKHIYSKLGISSQFELFSLFINHLVNEKGVEKLFSVT